jgi:hypothetical protein
MVTLAQLRELETAGKLYYSHFHYTGKRMCSRAIGPRGGEKISVTDCRVSGSLKTWKTRPTEFRLPVKYGMYESSAITHHDAALWHLAADCPLRAEAEAEADRTAEADRRFWESTVS